MLDLLDFSLFVAAGEEFHTNYNCYFHVIEGTGTIMEMDKLEKYFRILFLICLSNLYILIFRHLPCVRISDTYIILFILETYILNSIFYNIILMIGYCPSQLMFWSTKQY